MGLQNVMDGAHDVAEYDVLSHMNENGKFVIPLGLVLEQHYQDALERLMLRDWIRLIDISPCSTTGMAMVLQRVFIAMPAAREWYAIRRAA